MVGRVEQIRVPMPARFQLIGATNPCPCGGDGSSGDCQCDERSRHRYLGRLSGPLLDRFDLRVAVQRPDVSEILDGEPGESTADVAARVAIAGGSRSSAVARSTPRSTTTASPTSHRSTPAADSLIRGEIERGRLTGRGYHRVRRVARTLADLAGDYDGRSATVRVAAALGMRARVGLSAVGARHERRAPADRRPPIARCGAAVRHHDRRRHRPGSRPRWPPWPAALDRSSPPTDAVRAPRPGGCVRRLARRLRSIRCSSGPPRPICSTVAGRPRLLTRSGLEACRQRGSRCSIVATPPTRPSWSVDPEAPEVLFVRGDLAALDARRVGVIGTRNATASGLATATELGRELADAGVAVVSGWRVGIDGAAHAACGRRAGPGRPSPSSAVGLDVPYPKPTPTCGSGSPPRGCCCPSGRRARRRTPGASRSAIASSLRCARCWSSSRAASRAAA